MLFLLGAFQEEAKDYEQQEEEYEKETEEEIKEEDEVRPCVDLVL